MSTYLVRQHLTFRKLICFFPNMTFSLFYKVALVIGEYEYVEGRTNDGVLVRVFTPVGKKEQVH